MTNRFQRAFAALTDAPPPAETPAPDNRSVVARKKRWWLSRPALGGFGFVVCLLLIVWILLRDPHSGARKEGPGGPMLGRFVTAAGLGSSSAADEKEDKDTPKDEPKAEAGPRIDAEDIKAKLKSTGRFNRDRQQARSEGAQRDEQGAFDQALKVSRPRGAQAGLVPNEHLKMKPGTPISCAMNTFTDNGSGLVYGKCTVTREGGMNMTNTIALIPRGSTIEIWGERTASQGESRLFLTGATAHGRYEGGTSFHIDIMSAVGDALGATGVVGRRDTQFSDRLWGSALLGLVGDAAAVGQNALIAAGAPGGRGVAGAGQAAATSLRYSVNIPVRYQLRQGEEIVVLLQRWADFTNQIELEALR